MNKNKAIFALCMVLQFTASLAQAVEDEDDYATSEEAKQALAKFRSDLQTANDAGTGMAIGIIILIIVGVLLCVCVPIGCVIYCCYKGT